MQSYSGIHPEIVVIAVLIFTPPARRWLQRQSWGRRPWFLLSSRVCPRVADVEGLDPHVITQSPRNDLLSHSDPWVVQYWGTVCAGFSFSASLSITAPVTCDMTLPSLGRF